MNAWKCLFGLLWLVLASPLAWATNYDVVVGGGEDGCCSFTPTNLTINVGDTVTWHWAGSATHSHNVVAAGVFRCAQGCDGEGGNGNPSSAAWTVTRTFTSVGTMGYYCEVHVGLGMKGTITVSGGAPATNYQGLWWAAPAGVESGWGINFAHQGDVIFATWFTYDTTGKGWWLVMTAQKMAPNTYSGTLYRTSGPAFNAVPFNPQQVTATQVGSGTLTFSDASNGTFSYTVNGISQVKSITREVFGALPTCGAASGTADLTAATNYQDLWWTAPAGVESGWGANFTHQGDTIFATWFTYDLDGTPLWLVVTAQKTGPGSYTGTLYRTTGPAFNAVPFNPANVTATAVGSATLTFTDGNTGTFAYTVNGVSQVKAITREVFSGSGTVCRAAAATAQGVWTGTTSASEPALAVVLDDGTYYVDYALPGTTQDAGVFQGTATMASGTFSSSDAVDFPIAQATETGGFASTASVSGSFVAQVSLQLSLSGHGSVRSLSATYVSGSDQPPSLAAAAGSYGGWTGHVSGRRSATVSLDSAGNFSGSNEAGCILTGTATPRTSVNAFDWTITGNANCIFGRGPISGVLYYDAAMQRLYAFAPFAGRLDEYFFVGTKQ